MKISDKAKHAILLGVLCSVSYLAVYIARNILSAVTPQMISSGIKKEYIGSVSSLYFIFYAGGQLINGAIGDKIKAKYMISFGLLLAGVMNFIFPYVINYQYGAMVVYAMTGFFLSMIYGPMTKVVSENTEPLHATRCSLGYTFASFLGTPSAGVLATLFVWQTAFTVSSLTLATMAVIAFIFFAVFEKKGIVKYGLYKPQKKSLGNIKVLFKHKIVKFSLISIITGIVRTSVVFWLSTYFMEYLGLSPELSSSIFSIATFIISLTTFIAVFVYEKTGYNLDRTVLIMFSSATICFTLTYFVKLPVLNIVFIVLSIMSSGGAASMLYSRYCPSLRDTGMVSSVTGFLDCLSYIAAASANIIFANASTTLGWGNLILVWLGLMILGVIVALPYDKIFKNKQLEENANQATIEE